MPRRLAVALTLNLFRFFVQYGVGRNGSGPTRGTSVARILADAPNQFAGHLTPNATGGRHSDLTCETLEEAKLQVLYPALRNPNHPAGRLARARLGAAAEAA
jgi:hypothetical protein